MKIIIKDNLNIKNEEIHVKPTRVKMFILHNNEYVLISAFEGYQLPGGHVEEGEDLTIAVIREVEEETGIKLNKEEIPVPFFRIERYSKTESNQNKCSTIIYYYIETEKSINMGNRHLTEHEKSNNYDIKCIHKNNIEQELNYIINNSPNQGSRIVAEETLFAYNILKEELNV